MFFLGVPPYFDELIWLLSSLLSSPRAAPVGLVGAFFFLFMNITEFFPQVLSLIPEFLFRG